MREPAVRFLEKVASRLGSNDDGSYWEIRSELQRLKHTIATIPGMDDPANIRLIIKLLDINGEAYRFNTEVKSKLSAESYNKLATIFDVGTVAVLGVQDFLAGEDLDVGQLMIGIFASSLTVLGSLQYVQAWSDEVESILREKNVHLYDWFWDLPEEFRYKIKDEKIADVQDGLDKLFTELRNEKVPQEVRIAIIMQLYKLIFSVYLRKLTKELESL